MLQHGDLAERVLSALLCVSRCVDQGILAGCLVTEVTGKHALGDLS